MDKLTHPQRRPPKPGSWGARQQEKKARRVGAEISRGIRHNSMNLQFMQAKAMLEHQQQR
jgi:hypothetical protein